VPLASRPLTLGLLRRAIGSGGKLPETASELYARGLRALADEQNRERRGRALTTGNPDERLSVAARMAAISIFSGRAAIWIGPVGDAEVSDLTFDDCIEFRSDVTSTRMSSDTQCHATSRPAHRLGPGCRARCRTAPTRPQGRRSPRVDPRRASVRPPRRWVRSQHSGFPGRGASGSTSPWVRGSGCRRRSRQTSAARCERRCWPPAPRNRPRSAGGSP
jgi:hypothetical protein